MKIHTMIAAADLRFVENTEPNKTGEGLWRTTSVEPSDSAIDVPDAVSIG
jgi:hypothetical protein